MAGLEAIAHVVRGTRVLWLALVDSEPVAFEVPPDAMLREAPVSFVSPAADLVLTTRDTAGGIAVELNHQPSNDEYEMVARGAFALQASGTSGA